MAFAAITINDKSNQSFRAYDSSGHSITAHYANPIRGNSGLLKAEISYRVGDVGCVLLVGASAPARMADRSMREVTSLAFARGNVAQGNDLPALKLKKCHFIKRAPDRRRRNSLGSCCRDKMEGLGNVNVRPAQISKREGRVNHGVESYAG